MAKGLNRLKNRIRGAKKKIKKATRVRDHAKKQTKHWRIVFRNAPVGSPRRRRARRKVKFWRSVRMSANRQLAYWRVILSRRARKKQAYLKKHPPGPVNNITIPDRSWNPYRRSVCGWMIPWLDKAWNNGWRGVIVSGVRTPEQSEGLCFDICNRPFCPGLCAGRSSNHNATTGAFPQGAVDATDYYNLANIFRRIGAPLRNDLPNDRVHFSNSGH